MFHIQKHFQIKSTFVIYMKQVKTNTVTKIMYNGEKKIHLFRSTKFENCNAKRKDFQFFFATVRISLYAKFDKI